MLRLGRRHDSARGRRRLARGRPLRGLAARGFPATGRGRPRPGRPTRQPVAAGGAGRAGRLPGGAAAPARRWHRRPRGGHERLPPPDAACSLRERLPRACREGAEGVALAEARVSDDLGAAACDRLGTLADPGLVLQRDDPARVSRGIRRGRVTALRRDSLRRAGPPAGRRSSGRATTSTRTRPVTRQSHG